MKTNDLKKGTPIRLRNGWWATIADNAKGNIRMATVHGNYTETGSVYSHDIETTYRALAPDEGFESGVEVVLPRVNHPVLKHGTTYVVTRITHTPQQIKLKAQCEGMGF